MTGSPLSNRFDSFLRTKSDAEEFVALMTNYTKRDGAAIIYAFNSLFDISWKMMKDSLNEWYGFDDVKPSPRDIIKKANSVELIGNEDQWLSMLKNRNLSTHDYMRTNQEYYCELIRLEYLPLMDELESTVRAQLETLRQEGAPNGGVVS